MQNSLAEATVPMSPQLSVRCALAVLVALLLASAIGLLALGPVAVAAAPRAGDEWLRLLSPWPMLAAAGCGLWWAGRVRRRAWRHAWRSFFRAAAVAAAFATFAAMSPPTLDGLSWKLARVAAGSACAVLSLIFLAERLGPRWIASRALMLALLAGPLAALAGVAAQALHGQPDDRLLLWLELLPLLMVPLGVWGLPSRGLVGTDWLVACIAFGAAKWAQARPIAVLAATQGLIDGWTLSRALIAATLLWLGWMLLSRQPGLARCGPVSPAAPEPSSAASQRDTSATTCG